MNNLEMMIKVEQMAKEIDDLIWIDFFKQLMSAEKSDWNKRLIETSFKSLVEEHNKIMTAMAMLWE